MVAALVPSPSPSSPLAVVGFTQVPNTVLLDPTLSRDARFLYTLLLQHARPRTGYVVRVGYARLCVLMDAGEDLVRRTMHELVAAGRVAQTRRGRGLVNTYRLLVTPPLSTRPARVLEPGERGFSVEEQAIEEDEREFDYSTSPPHMNVSEGPPGRSSSEPRHSAPQPAPAPRRISRPPVSLDPERDAVLALIGDLRHELGDRATVGSTTSRALNLYRQSDVSWEAFVTAVYSARAVTQARTSAIRRRDEVGVNKMPYMLAVLADRLGLREPSTAGASGEGETYPGVSAIAMEDVGCGAMTPPAHLPADPTGAARQEFWGQMAVETGIGDLRAYCRACGRPPRYDDLARSVGYVRERRGRAVSGLPVASVAEGDAQPDRGLRRGGGCARRRAADGGGEWSVGVG